MSCGFLKDGFCSKIINFVLIFFFSLFIIPTSDRCCYFHIFQDTSVVDDDFIYELFETQLKQTPRLSTEVPDLLSANQLLELVCDTIFSLIHLCSLDSIISSSLINDTKFGPTLLIAGFRPISSCWEDFCIDCI